MWFVSDLFRVKAVGVNEPLVGDTEDYSEDPDQAPKKNQLRIQKGDTL